MDDKRARIQKEYEESLKVSQSLLTGLGKLIDANADKSGKANSALDKQNKAIKSILKDIESQEDLMKGVLDLQDQRATVDQRYFGINQKLRGAKKAELDLAIDGLKAENDKLNAINQVDAAAKDLTETMNGSLDGILNNLNSIPVVGGLFKSLASGPVESLKGSISAAGEVFVTSFAKNLRSGVGGMQSLTAAAGSTAKAFTLLINPVTLLIVGIAALVGFAVAGFAKMDAAAKTFRNETGLTNSQMQGLDTTIQNVAMSNAQLGVSMEDVAKAAADFTNQFEGLMVPSQEVLGNVTAIEKNFGVAASTQAKVNSLFQETAGLSAEAAQFQIAQVTQAANLAGVAPTRVLEDIANSAEAASNYFGGSVEELSKAAVKAAALGTSIKQASEVADNLMDFESSINAELEASAMLGQSINFNKARELAATGDILGAQQSVLDSLESTVDLNNLNKFQLDSIAKASGMPVAELKKQLNLRKQFGKLDSQGMKAAEQLLASGKELSDISDSDLAAQTAQVRAQEEMQSKMDSLKNTFGAIGTTLMAALAPLGEMLIVPLISIGKILLPAIQLIGKLLGLAFKPVLLIFRLMQKVVDPIVDAFTGMFAELDPFFSKMDEMYTQLEKGIGPVFSFIGKLLGGVFSLIGSVIGVLIDGFMLLYDYVISPIISVISSIGSFLGLGGGNDEEPVAMAKGGVVNSPTNAIIGEAGPEAVIPLDKMGGMGSDAVVAAIQQLGNEIKNLQVQVNMDGRKVADGVSKVVQRSTENKFGVAT